MTLAKAIETGIILLIEQSGNCNFCEINKVLKDFFDQFTKSFNEFVVQNNGV